MFLFVYFVMLHGLFACVLFVLVCLCVFCVMRLWFLCDVLCDGVWFVLRVVCLCVVCCVCVSVFCL